MASPENIRAREVQEALLVALGGNPEATTTELRAGFEQWSAQYLPAPPELVTEPVDADGVPAVWAYLPMTTPSDVPVSRSGSIRRAPVAMWSESRGARTRRVDGRADRARRQRRDRGPGRARRTRLVEITSLGGRRIPNWRTSWMAKKAGSSPESASETVKRIEAIRSGGSRRDWGAY